MQQCKEILKPRKSGDHEEYSKMVLMNLNQLQVLVILWVLFTCHTPIHCLLYDYGASKGHQTTPFSDRGSGPALDVSPPFGFYGDLYSTVYVNNDGSLSFTSAADYQGTTSVSGTVTAVCGFCSDIDITKGGTVWYGFTTALTERQIFADDVRIYRDFPSDYLPSWVLVATWDGVASFLNTDSQVNTFQVILATDGSLSVVQLLYDTITWVEDTIDLSQYYDDIDPPEIRAQCGFLPGDGTTAYLLPGSRSDSLLNISQISNVGTPGRFVFRVDQGIVQPNTQSELSSTLPTSADVNTEPSETPTGSSTTATPDFLTSAPTDSSTTAQTDSPTRVPTDSLTPASTDSQTTTSTDSFTTASTDFPTPASEDSDSTQYLTYSTMQVLTSLKDISSSVPDKMGSELVSTPYTLQPSSLLSSQVSVLTSSITSSSPVQYLSLPYTPTTIYSSSAMSSSSVLSVSSSATSTFQPIPSSSSQSYDSFVQIATDTSVSSLATEHDTPTTLLITEELTGSVSLGLASGSEISADVFLSATSGLFTGTAFRDVIQPSESLLSVSELLLTSEDSIHVSTSPLSSHVSLSSSLLSSLPSLSSSSTAVSSSLSSSFISISSPSSSLSTIFTSTPSSSTSSLFSHSLTTVNSPTPILSTNNIDTPISTATNLHTYTIQTTAVMEPSSQDSQSMTSVTKDDITTITSSPDVLMSTVSQTDNSNQGVNPGSCVVITGRGATVKTTVSIDTPTTVSVSDTEGRQDEVLGFPFLTSVQKTVAPYIVTLFIVAMVLATIGMIQTSLWWRLIRKLSMREKIRRYRRSRKQNIPLKIITTGPSPYQVNNTSRTYSYN